MNISGRRFKIKYQEQEIELKFYSETKKAARARLGNSGQNIWIPKSCIEMVDGRIVNLNIDWLMSRYDFKHKMELINATIK